MHIDIPAGVISIVKVVQSRDSRNNMIHCNVSGFLTVET